MLMFEMCLCGTATNLRELGRTSVMEYGIKPIRIKPYSCPYKHKEVIYQEIEKA